MTATTSLSRPGAPLRRAATTLLAAAAVLLSACTTTDTVETVAAPKAPDIGLYELRIYAAADGKMDALNARVRDHEIPLFRKHGMTPIAFFTPVVEPGKPADNRLFYIMGYKDRAARDAAWMDFAKDQEWAKAYRASQADGALTTSIATTLYTPTAYSPKLNLAPAKSPRIFEVRTYHANPGKLEYLHERFRDHTLDIFAKHGMTSVLYWRPEPGQAGMEDRMTYLLAFPSVAARNEDWKAFSSDSEWVRVAADSNKDGPLLTQNGVVSVLLKPTAYSPLK
ncbi:MAG: NIPSNAP family protein [Alphaproteobacteria bacterium]|nr:NIPSNAP family protein [Alphaproteobacteria bacterium]